MSIDTIASAEVIPVRMEMKVPFSVAGGDYPYIDKAIVRMRTKAGRVGLGEAVPIHTSSEETIESIVGALEHYLIPACIGLSPVEMSVVHSAMDSSLYGNPYAKAAIGIAVGDLAGKIFNVPLCVLLGGKYRASISLAQSMGAMTPTKAAERAKEIVSQGFAVVKMKVGRDAEADLASVQAVRDAVGDGVRIRVDANGGYRDVVTARDVLIQMHATAGLYMAEQPIDRRDLLGMAHIRDNLAVPLLADESVFDVADALSVLRMGAADVINVKVQKAGGVFPAMKVVAAAEGASAPVLVGSHMETGIGTAASAHLVSAIPRLPHPCDIKTPTAFRDDLLVQPVRIEGGQTYLPEGPGLGVELDDEKLRRYEIT